MTTPLSSEASSSEDIDDLENEGVPCEACFPESESRGAPCRRMLRHYLGRAVWLNNHMACVKALVDMGADVDGVDMQQVTPLVHASRGANLAMINLLVSLGANVNLPATRNRRTPLAVAAAHGHVEIIRALIALKADPHRGSDAGWNVLHHSVAGFDHEPPKGCGVRTLLALGVDRTFSFTSGSTPYNRFHVISLALRASERQNGGPETVMALLADYCRAVP